MRRRLRSHLTYANVMVTLLAFVVLGGGVAYAANTVFSSDIVDNQVYSADVRNDSLAGGGLAAADLQTGSVKTAEVLNDTATGGGLGASDLGPGSVGHSEVIDNSLTGADINESSLKSLHTQSLFSSYSNSHGPLPIQEDFTSQGGELAIYVSGSAFRSSANAQHPGSIAINAYLDGTFLGSVGVFTNELDSHRALIGKVFAVHPAPGTHTLRLENANFAECNSPTDGSVPCTTTDPFDSFAANVIELP